MTHPLCAVLAVAALSLAACGDISVASDDGGSDAQGPAGAAGTAPSSSGGTTGAAGAAGTAPSSSGGTTGAAGTLGIAGTGSGGSSKGGTTGAAGGTTGAAGTAPSSSGGTTGAAGSSAGEGGTTGAAGAGPPITRAPKVETKNTSAGQSAITVTLRVWNNDQNPLALSRLKLRYWYTADATLPAAQSATCLYSSASSGGCPTPALVRVMPARPSSDYFAEVSFKPEAGALAPSAGSSLEIGISWSKADGSTFDQGNDWSGFQGTDFAGNTHVTVYIDGALAVGTEP